MKQGTISWLIGCHSIGHSILVLRAWRKIYGRWPKAWQVTCIFLHDIGHIGLQYLDSFDEKQKHWELGACIARCLFGQKGYDFLSGHCSHSGHTVSELYRADKHSWYIAPTWWLLWNNIVEPKLTINCNGNMDAVRKFQAAVRRSIETGEYTSTHEMYLNRAAGRE